ncbi:radical SAM/SPASM domain-containing protein [Citrifermentans pelophilum]|nr:radical SAM protein [Geoanaerobacter pelophilus]
MDGHKLLWHLDRVNQWVKGERIAPLHIDLGITTGCNIDCSFCYGVLQGRTGASSRFDMPKGPLLRFLREAKEAGVRSVLFDGQGENTLNSALYDAVACCGEIELSCALATNGTLLRRERMAELLAPLTWLRINISAATPESYRRIHGAPLFDKVVENIRLAVETRNNNGLATTIGMQMVLTYDNLDDIVPLSKLGAELGVDYLVIKPCSDDPQKSLNAPTGEYLELAEVFRAAEACSSNGYNVVVKANKLANSGLKDFPRCFGTRFIINISGDGSVFPCGHFFSTRREEFCMGNILENSFGEILSSDRYWSVQDKIASIDVNRECETNCRHYYICGFLWKLRNPPPHLDFI